MVIEEEVETVVRKSLEELKEERREDRIGFDKEQITRDAFPMVAIVGQDMMKMALVLNVVNPNVGGVLIRGQKGTGKSIAVRGLEEILPEVAAHIDCKFTCDPRDTMNYCGDCQRREAQGGNRREMRKMEMVNLPLNITDDRLLGSIDIEKILSDGVKSFEPGILAESNRGVLYVDEINLLEDTVVDVLLDAAAMGHVTVEREGISVRYPAAFIFVGSMNPEEGELRPQLQDRLALQAIIEGSKDPKERVEIIKRRREFEADPVSFRRKWRPEEESMRKRIVAARTLMPKVTVPDRITRMIGRLGIDFKVDGHRADIIIERASKAHAAYMERTEVTIDDLIIAAQLTLPQRMRAQPFQSAEFSLDELKQHIGKYQAEESG